MEYSQVGSGIQRKDAAKIIKCRNYARALLNLVNFSWPKL